MYLVSRVLVRAPLLPERALAGARVDEPLLAAAAALANPALEGRALPSGYARRAAFRPTPHGLFAGVCAGVLGERTRIATGTAVPRLDLSWAKAAALGRALLDDAEARGEVRLRAAPSWVRAGDSVEWLAFGAGAVAAWMRAELDEPLAMVLEATGAWRAWHEVRARLIQAGAGDDDAADDYLRALVADRLLITDLEPPLVGAAPLTWLRARFADRASAFDALARELEAAHDAAALRAVRARVQALPGAADEPLHAVLTFAPARPPQIARAAVERAASLAPLLFRLQDALVPPAAERALDPAIDEALAAMSETFGVGAYPLTPLAGGDYGTALAGDTVAGPRAAPVGLLAHLADALLAAARADLDELALDPAALDAMLPPAGAPGTFEIFLQPMREPRGRPAGTGWLLGLHAPAGASWGRFSHALGAPLGEALAELDAAERRLRPSERRVDVAFAPSAALADVAAHAPVRSGALALSGWTEEAVAPDALELCVDPAALAPLALREGAQPIVPSPLHRLRSTTAPRGMVQLLCGWSLVRQHTPWALALGAFGRLARTPRVTLDGFVIAPASWRVPDELTTRSLRAWRRAAGVPRWVQVGHEDELLPIDLDARDAAAELARRLASRDDAQRRAWEIWPPLGESLDADGRRIEIVAAVVVPEDAHAQAAARAIASVETVPPPYAPDGGAAPGWRTFKLFGAAERHDRVLLGAVQPAVEAARAAGEIDAWFFLPYVEQPGRREHLRVRVHGAVDGAEGARAFAARLAAVLEPARAEGDVVAVEEGPYHPERARFGREAMTAVEQIFEASSELACTLLAGGDEEDEADLVELVVRGYDALATGLGLTPPERREAAGRRRLAHADAGAAATGGPDPHAAEFRARKPRLQAALLAPREPFRVLAERTAAAAATLSDERRRAILSPLLHLHAVRMAGVARDRAIEAHAYYLWERTLDGLRHRAK